MEFNDIVGRIVTWGTYGKEKIGLVLEAVPPGSAITKLPKDMVKEDGSFRDHVKFKAIVSSSPKRRLLVAVPDIKGARGKIGEIIYYAPYFDNCAVVPNPLGKLDAGKAVTYLRQKGLY